MTVDLWERIDSILQQALQMPESEREAFVNRASARDAAVSAEVMSLLAQFDEDPGYLEDIPLRTHPPDYPQVDSPVTIGGYRIIRPIARGGMGQVHLATRDESEFRQYVALKVLRRGLDTEDVLGRFRAERRILASLSHENIARFLDGGATDEGLPYFVMEYVDGLPITEYCDRHGLSVNERLDLFRTVCNAVQFAHRNLVVHRDLKPSNILVTAGGVPKLLDFGIAKIIDPAQSDFDQPLTRTEMRVLTPDYAAPEQVLRQPITTAADIYSLGILLFEMLTGHRPYRLSGRSVTELERAILEQEPALASVTTPDDPLRKRLRGDLDTIIQTSLKKDPGRRYASVEQLSEDVRRHLQGLPILARPDTFGYRWGKFARRNRLGVTAGAAIVVVLIGFAAAMVWQNARVEARAAEATRERDRAREVSNFLVNLFESSDPTHTSGEEVTAQELLERGVKAVGEELDHQPELQAEMMAVLGRVYASIGQYDRALELATESLRQRRDLLPAGHPDVAAGLNDVGGILTAMSRHTEAETAFQEALSLRLSALGTEHVDVAATMKDYGWLLILLGRYTEADSLYRRALLIREAVHGSAHPEVAEALNDMGVLYRRIGDLHAAGDAHARAMEIRRTTLGEGHRYYAQSLNNLAIVREQLGDHESSDTLLSTAISVLGRVLGPEHPHVDLYVSNLAKQRYYVGRYDDADSLFRLVLGHQRQRLGHRHVDIALTLVDLGQIEHRRGNLDEAERLFRDALDMRREILGAAHHDVGFVMSDLAFVSRDRGRPDIAEAHFRESLRITRSALPKRHFHHARALIGLGEVLCASGRGSEAEAALREGWELRREAFGESDPRTKEAADALAACAGVLGSVLGSGLDSSSGVRS